MSISNDLKRLREIVGTEIDFSTTWDKGRNWYVFDFRGRLDHIAEGLSTNGKMYTTSFHKGKGCAQILEPGSLVVIAEIEVRGESDTADWMIVRLVREQQRLKNLFESLLPDCVSVEVFDSL